MKNISIYFIFLILFTQCNKDSSPDCLKKSGNITSTEIELPSEVCYIILNDNIKLNLFNTSGETSKITLTGAENLMSGIDFNFSENQLEISNTNSCNWVREYDHFELNVYSDSITRIYNWGSGGVHTHLYEADEFTFEQEASLADNLIGFSGETLTVNLHSSAGYAEVSGQSANCNLYANGVCFLTARELECAHISANNSGENDIYVSPTSSLHGVIRNSGNIFYLISEINLSTDIQGSGEVAHSEF